jgi:hypothetical protein
MAAAVAADQVFAAGQGADYLAAALCRALDDPGRLIPYAALLFTLFAFYWMHWRAGKLVITEPKSLLLGRPNGALMFYVPLVFVNTGARPVIVRNLRLVLPDAGGEAAPFFFNGTLAALTIKSEHNLAIQFPVHHDGAVSLICEFARRPAALTFQERAYTAEIQGKLGTRKNWEGLCRFQIPIPGSALPAVNGHIGTFPIDIDLGMEQLGDGPSSDK